MDFTLTIRLEPELMQLAKEFVAAQVPTTMAEPKKAKKTVKAEPKEEPTPQEEPAVESEEPAQEEPESDSPGYTLESVKAAVQKKIAEDKRTEVKELLTKFEASNVVALAKESYAAFMVELEAV